MCCGAQHVSVTEHVLIWHGPRVYLNVNKCFSCILNEVCSLNSQRRRKDGGGKCKKSERRRQIEEERGGKERKSVHVPLCTQPRAATPLSLSISVCGAERRGVIRRQGRESVVPPVTYTNIMHAALATTPRPSCARHIPWCLVERSRMQQCHNTTTHAFLMNDEGIVWVNWKLWNLPVRVDVCLNKLLTLNIF